MFKLYSIIGNLKREQNLLTKCMGGGGWAHEDQS